MYPSCNSLKKCITDENAYEQDHIFSSEWNRLSATPLWKVRFNRIKRQKWSLGRKWEQVNVPKIPFLTIRMCFDVFLWSNKDTQSRESWSSSQIDGTKDERLRQETAEELENRDASPNNGEKNWKVAGHAGCGNEMHAGGAEEVSSAVQRWPRWLMQHAVTSALQQSGGERRRAELMERYNETCEAEVMDHSWSIWLRSDASKWTSSCFTWKLLHTFNRMKQLNIARTICHY